MRNLYDEPLHSQSKTFQGQAQKLVNIKNNNC